MAINFYTKSINFTLKHKGKRRLWINELITQHNKIIGDLSFIFVSDHYLLSINKKHLRHNYYTDIITFPLNINNDRIEGDVLISIDRVLANAQTYKSTFETELTKVMAHGILHLIGFSDKSTKEQTEMRKQENIAITLFSMFI